MPSVFVMRAKPKPSVRVTQVISEVLVKSPPDVRVTQTVVEVLVK